MTKRILLINSDLAKNRGDRAIAEGNILLIKERFPEAIITGISELPERDKEWYGIDFLDMNFQSVSPLDLLRLCRFARSQDIILWGGGEILKDYTNKAALWYWVLKMGIIRLANSNVYGMYQGIGPTKSRFNRKLIAYTVNRSKHFIVRDEESRNKLIEWGAGERKVSFASDPAVLPSPHKIDEQLIEKLRQDYGIEPTFLNNFVCIGPRDWFHYKTSGILPYKYMTKLDNLLGKQSASGPSPQNRTYRKQLNTLVEHITNDLGLNVLLVPMHMEESDVALCNRLKKHASQPKRIRVLDNDTLSPSELRNCMSAAKLMIGFRLHSNIIAVSSGVPSLNIYYVDKGRVFFDQIKQSNFAIPIESTLKPDFDKTSQTLIRQLLNGQVAHRDAISTQTKRLRKDIRHAFLETFSGSEANHLDESSMREKVPLLGFRIGRRKFSLLEIADRYLRAMGAAFFVEFYMRIVPLKRKRRFILYGHALDGNLKAFADYLHENHTELEVVLMVDDPTAFRRAKHSTTNQIKVISSQTLSGLLTAAHSQIIVTSHGPISLKRWQLLPKSKRPIFVDTWHGVGYKGRVDDAIQKMKDYDCHFVPSTLVKEFYKNAGIDENRIAVTGFARADRFTALQLSKKQRQQLLASYSLDTRETRSLVLYAPTWNEVARASDIFPFGLSASEFLGRMNDFAKENNSLILLRPHLNTRINLDSSHTNLKVMTTNDFPQVEPLLLLSDVLITDWSSIISEFSILNRPILFIDRPPTFAGHVAPLTKADRPGALVSSWKQFENELTQAIAHPLTYIKRFEATHERTLDHAWSNTLDGKSSQRYMSEITRLIGR